jgi:outer membrane protein assembly factor BamE (lipoprotein component of BamABCDE complex)
MQSLQPSRPRRLAAATFRALLAGVAMLAVAGCEKVIDVRGHVPDDDSLSKIQVGLQKKADVTDLLGTPSTVAPFGEETWLYISRKTSTTAFFEPKVLEQHVVAIVFDDTGAVSDVRRLDMADGKVIRHVARITPSPGKELSFLEQLIGNLGKFNSGKGGALSPSSTGGGLPGSR